MNNILIVDDEVAMREALEASFRRRGWQVQTAAGVSDALSKFRNAPAGVVVTDMRMGDGDGLQVMQGVRAFLPETPVILLTAYGSVPGAVQAIQEGACDYLQKPISFDQLEAAAERFMPTPEKSEPGEAFFEGVACSPSFRAVLARAQRVAQTEADILIEAESGTGKELLARLIHRCSPRSEGPFVAVNCAAFPDNLLESELFGHVRGAFTGANNAKPGKFELADGGTLLLDEIGEMPMALQPKLLRVLQEREVDRLGDTRPMRVDVRVIATTNRSLRAAVEAGRFRADLYYRLNVVPLAIPPLRERAEDIPAMAKHFLRKHEPKAQRGLFQISPEFEAQLQERDWPGNVRELENFIRRALGFGERDITYGSAGWPGWRHMQRNERGKRPRRRHAAERRAPAPGEDAARHRWKPHAHRGNDGSKPAHRAQQNPRVRIACVEGVMSWINSAHFALLERFLDVTAMRQTIVSTNVANVDTPGYARQRVDLAEAPPVQLGNLTFGTGVQLQHVTSLRDSILDLRVNQETQQQGKLSAFLGSAQQIQALFNETTGTGLQTSLTAFFSRLSQLSANPSDLSVRQAVISAAQALTSAFNQASTNVTTQQRNVDLSVAQSVQQINTLTAQIAKVNAQVSASQINGQNAGPFADQRQQLINQLSNLVDVSEIDAGHGSLTLTTSSGAPLVVGGQSFQLTTQPDAATGLLHVFSQGGDITAKITAGQLAGQLQVRDQEIPGLQNSLDTLASGLATAVNTQHRAGVDLNGAPGGNFFVPPSALAGAAAGLALAITDPAKIAASATGAVGDNTNANAILALQNQAITAGQTPLNFYSNIVFKLGNDISTATTDQQSGALVLSQIQDLQGGVSGVDINEEASNLIRFQNAYQASAQVSSVINTLLQATINLIQ